MDLQKKQDNEYQELAKIETYIRELPQMVNDSSPNVSKIIVYSSLVGSMLATAFFMSTSETFSPMNTNSVNVFVNLVCHLGIVIGPASLFALKALNYSVVPKHFASKIPQVQGIRSSFLSLNFQAAVIPILMMGSVTLIDSLNLIYTGPQLFWLGLCTTSMSYAQKNLSVPLWMSRQFTQFSIISIFACLLISFKILDNNFRIDESRKVLLNIQKQLDS